jgi:hypothetical protein
MEAVAAIVGDDAGPGKDRADRHVEGSNSDSSSSSSSRGSGQFSDFAGLDAEDMIEVFNFSSDPLDPMSNAACFAGPLMVSTASGAESLPASAASSAGCDALPAALMDDDTAALVDVVDMSTAVASSSTDAVGPPLLAATDSLTLPVLTEQSVVGIHNENSSFDDDLADTSESGGRQPNTIVNNNSSTAKRKRPDITQTARRRTKQPKTNAAKTISSSASSSESSAVDTDSGKWRGNRSDLCRFSISLCFAYSDDLQNRSQIQAASVPASGDPSPDEMIVDSDSHAENENEQSSSAPAANPRPRPDIDETVDDETRVGAAPFAERTNNGADRDTAEYLHEGTNQVGSNRQTPSVHTAADSGGLDTRHQMMKKTARSSAIRVGEQYQADVPAWCGPPTAIAAEDEASDPAMKMAEHEMPEEEIAGNCVWRPGSIDSPKLRKYLFEANNVVEACKRSCNILNSSAKDTVNINGSKGNDNAPANDASPVKNGEAAPTFRPVVNGCIVTVRSDAWSLIHDVLHDWYEMVLLICVAPADLCVYQSSDYNPEVALNVLRQRMAEKVVEWSIQDQQQFQGAFIKVCMSAFMALANVLTLSCVGSTEITYTRFAVSSRISVRAISRNTISGLCMLLCSWSMWSSDC